MRTIYGLFTIVFFFIIITVKKVEDYIALFSQHQTQRLVSIYQKRITDDEGHLDGGLDKQSFIFNRNKVKIAVNNVDNS